MGNNGIGVTGVTWNCKVMPIRLGYVNRGTLSGLNGGWCAASDCAAAFRWAASNGADVMSNSWFGVASPIILHSAIRDVTAPGGIGRGGRGCVVLFAAGNDSTGIGFEPAYAEVIAVGGTDHNDHLTWYSDFGPELDVTAPTGGGVQTQDLGLFMTQSTDLLWTTDITGEFGWSPWNTDANRLDYTEKCYGTSGATPIAAGVAALILSVEPNLTSDEVRHFLSRSAKDLGDPGPDDYYGWGRVDARAALDMVLAKRADLNNDWKVDEEDRAILVKAMETQDLSADIAPAAKRDGVVDSKDLELLMRYWHTQIPEMTVPEPGLIAHWKLDEAEGSVAHTPQAIGCTTGRSKAILPGSLRGVKSAAHWPLTGRMIGSPAHLL